MIWIQTLHCPSTPSARKAGFIRQVAIAASGMTTSITAYNPPPGYVAGFALGPNNIFGVDPGLSDPSIPLSRRHAQGLPALGIRAGPNSGEFPAIIRLRSIWYSACLRQVAYRPFISAVVVQCKFASRSYFFALYCFQGRTEIQDYHNESLEAP